MPELQELESQKIPTNEVPINQLEDTLNNTATTVEPNKTEDNVSKSVESADVIDENRKEQNVDPTVLKYRKMLQFGVPRGAVELKMVHEGLDPKLL